MSVIAEAVASVADILSEKAVVEGGERVCERENGRERERERGRGRGIGIYSKGESECAK